MSEGSTPHRAATPRGDGRAQALVWLASDDLRPLFIAVARRLERNGLRPTGTLTLADVTAGQAEALSGLLGVPVRAGTVKVKLDYLDRRLRDSAASAGLTDVTATVMGPLTSRPQLRQARISRQQQLWDDLDRSLTETGLGDQSWVGPWAAALRRAGIDQGPDTSTTLRAVLGAISDILTPTSTSAEARTPRGRHELATRHFGTAHGLDDGTTPSRLVLRALALHGGHPEPTTASERRHLWDLYDVTVDRVSATILTWNLTLTPDHPLAQAQQQRAAIGAEHHLTLRDVTRHPLTVPANTPILVCENPRLVEAAADRRLPVQLLCTQGNPTTAVTVALAQLHASGAHLSYHGDFDWPGIAIANRMMAAGLTPWRMSHNDYLADLTAAETDHIPLPTLVGPPVQATWDDHLHRVMLERGLAIHEETHLNQLLDASVSTHH